MPINIKLFYLINFNFKSKDNLEKFYENPRTAFSFKNIPNFSMSTCAAAGRSKNLRKLKESIKNTRQSQHFIIYL